MRRTLPAVLLAVTGVGLFLAAEALAAGGARANSGMASGSADRFELYVDALRGDDSGNCRMLNSPCRSIQRALESLPAMLRRDTVIRIAPGEYRGEIAICDRTSTDRRTLTLSGEAGESIIDGGSTQRFGLMISGSTAVELGGLTLRGFNGDGLLVSNTAPVALHDMVITHNIGHGLNARLTEISIRGAEIDDNGEDGIHCREGWLTIERHERRDGLFVRGNDGYGLRAAACEVRFEGAAQVRENARGILSEHGAQIDLGGHADIVLMGNTRSPGNGQGPISEPSRPPVGVNDAVAGCEMIAEHHGVIIGYGRAITDAICACGESGYGICRP